MTDPKPTQPEDEAKKWHPKLSWLMWPFMFLAVLAIQAWVVKPVQVPSGSMRPTIKCKDRLLVDRITPRLNGYEPGQIVVFVPPRQPGTAPTDPHAAEQDVEKSDPGSGFFKPWRETYIKRLVAQSGDTVEVKDGIAWVNGDKLDEPYAAVNEAEGLNWGPAKVPESSYFVLGDNRTNSADSRYIGFIPASHMVGIARWQYWPIPDMGSISDRRGSSLDAPLGC